MPQTLLLQLQLLLQKIFGEAFWNSLPLPVCIDKFSGENKATIKKQLEVHLNSKMHLEPLTLPDIESESDKFCHHGLRRGEAKLLLRFLQEFRDNFGRTA